MPSITHQKYRLRGHIRFWFDQHTKTMPRAYLEQAATGLAGRLAAKMTLQELEEWWKTLQAIEQFGEQFKEE